MGLVELNQGNKCARATENGQRAVVLNQTDDEDTRGNDEHGVPGVSGTGAGVGKARGDLERLILSVGDGQSHGGEDGRSGEFSNALNFHFAFPFVGLLVAEIGPEGSLSSSQPTEPGVAWRLLRASPR